MSISPRPKSHRISNQYGRSKAKASALCLEYAKKGLNVSIVQPSGIIGPGDKRKTNHSVASIAFMAKGFVPVRISGGFDFVDVRDVAQGILLCAEAGKTGECYILSGHYIDAGDLISEVDILCGRKPPRISVYYKPIRLVAILIEKVSKFIGIKRPLITAYSIDILNGNGHFSHQKATDALGYEPRPITETLADMIAEFNGR